MNTELLNRILALARTHDIVLEEMELGTTRDDYDVRLTFDAGRRGSKTYFAVVEDEFTDVGASVLPLPSKNPLLVARHVSDAQAEALRRRGADYIDSAGNMNFDWDRLLIRFRGFKPLPVRSAKSSTNAPGPDQSRIFSRSGLQVVFALLSWPHLQSAPLRDIATASMTSLGTTHKVIDELEKSGYLYGDAGRRRMSRGGELASRWVEQYATRLSSRLANGRFSAPDPQWWRAVGDFEEYGVLLGGELAASLLDPHLRPATSTLYSEEVPVRLLVESRLRRNDTGDVFLRRRFWRLPSLEDTSGLVPELLIYADLMASGDPRQIEHAERMRRTSDRFVAIDGS
ncbi:type IV toxin-antitoxin system AbiEi family antitoxin [Cellulomonas sp. 179-A 4D5 NHS]|uniref:type IV toxin-antitoxin system AbiEi family antitoxin n=1 Tax=Cellulomonas sp. 179-A 4D5 NHS TaxID=3142378 RepID=UPI0039A1757D